MKLDNMFMASLVGDIITVRVVDKLWNIAFHVPLIN